jgi:hypothetical protein
VIRRIRLPVGSAQTVGCQVSVTEKKKPKNRERQSPIVEVIFLRINQTKTGMKKTDMRKTAGIFDKVVNAYGEVTESQRREYVPNEI